MISKLLEKLRNEEYRKAFVGSQINIGIPFQIRALLKTRPGWTQETLAQRTGMLQPRISGLMTPGKTRPNIETLRRIAEAFDVGLQVRFVPYSELIRQSDAFDPENFYVPSFDEEAAQRDAQLSGASLLRQIVNRDGASRENPSIGGLASSEESGLDFGAYRRPVASANSAESKPTPVGYSPANLRR